MQIGTATMSADGIKQKNQKMAPTALRYILTLGDQALDNIPARFLIQLKFQKPTPLRLLE